MADDNTEEDVVEVNPLSLSDEDFEKQSFEDIIENTEESTTDDITEEVIESTAEGTTEEATETADESNVEDTQEDTSETEATEEETTAGEEDTTASIDYKAEYEKLMAPFKANGHEIRVDSVEDVISLKQMGANYNKKMAGLKPNLKLMKMLENNGLLNEDKLNYLIDLDKKDPNAISKLVKESEIDPLDIQVESADEYQPNTYNVNDKEVELDGILEEIQDTESYDTTIDIIGNKWDDASKEKLLENPSDIKLLNNQVATGIYKQINQVVESERMLGRLTGYSDIEAYKVVGDAMTANGAFGTPTAVANTTTPVNTPIDTAKSRNLKSRKKAASSTKSTGAPKVKKAYNPLSMSDEEFEKMSSAQFI